MPEIELNGERVTLAEAARQYGLSEQTVRSRWERGKRDPQQLLRDPRKDPQKNRTEPIYYSIGWSIQKWRLALRQADKIGDDAEAAEHLGVPIGALEAARKGEDHRLD